MGIDFRIQGIELDYTECPNWAYSSFNSFRSELADKLGIQLDAMSGFGGVTAWDTFEEDPIHLFLNHSDCDGKLLPDECAKVAPRLKALLPHVESEFDQVRGQLLVRMMEKCVEADRPLIFC